MITDGAAHVEAVFQRALALHQQSRLDEARALYEQTLRFEPRHFRALHLLGIIALQNNQAELAIELIGKAIVVEPLSVAAHVNYGNAQAERQRFDDAVASYDKAIALQPDCAEAFHNRGNALRELKQHAAAVASYDRAVALKPDYAEAYLNRGLALSDLNQREAAIASYDKAISIRPDSADPYYNRGNELRSLVRYEEALSSYDKAVSLQPGFADAHLNRGGVLVELHRYTAALTSYDKAIAVRPDYAEAHFNRAGALQHLGQYAAAVASYDTAISIRPNHAPTHANRGRALRELKRYEAAIASYDTAISLDADSTALHAVRRHIKLQVCDWADWEADVSKITAGIRSGTAAPNPFYVLTLSDSAALQRRAAENWVLEESPPNVPLGEIPKPLVNIPNPSRSDRIHVGYFSADFHDHATSYLIAQLFELHDRSRFRVTAISFGPDSHGPMRKRLRAACDEFIDVRGRSDAEVALRARNMGIDIAVDLKGFTQDHRAGIFARRTAPVQVNYLGYPGTMGAPYMDYLIADRVLVPAASQSHYTEKIIHLPHSYQVNDARRRIAEKVFTRAELGLPPTGFVFCCFNNSYKILPPTFDRWMRLLVRVPDSVLWLLADNPTAVGNLWREASARGVDPRRLVFADRLDLPHHLARHRAADLFIDTLPCNAHTTASDALWAGLPVLTCVGEALAARVAASLLTAIGLPELIASTLGQYEELAVHLATHPEQMAEIRRRLSENRLVAPLFDTPLYTRHIEAAFTLIYERYQADLPPDYLFIGSD
jgi:predicted O-linked N-acetylglucosamine transferase (SPINDLY family)